MDIKRALVWRVLALVKVKALKKPKKHWGCPMDQVEIGVLEERLEFFSCMSILSTLY
jgi:hypothetical protein